VTRIRTSRVEDRRELSFESLDDILVDVQHLGAGGEPRSTGNWSPGQNVQHLARLMHLSIDGFGGRRLPKPIQWIIRLAMKNRIMRDGMKPGVNPPRKFDIMMPDPIVAWEDGVAELREGIERLNRERAEAESPVLGRLTHEEWITLHLRHAEMHLSFLHSA